MVPQSTCIPVPSEVTLLFSGFGVREGWIDPRTPDADRRALDRLRLGIGSG
jgi:hypothetical protein